MIGTNDSIARNAQLLREGYEAFSRGDLKAVEERFRPDAVWHAHRLGQLGGDHRGWPAILQFFGRTMELTQGTFHIEVEDVLASESRVAVVLHSRGSRAGETLDSLQVHLYRMDGDRVAEAWQFVGDWEAVERFWK